MSFIFSFSDLVFYFIKCQHCYIFLSNKIKKFRKKIYKKILHTHKQTQIFVNMFLPIVFLFELIEIAKVSLDIILFNQFSLLIANGGVVPGRKFSGTKF